MTPSSATRLRSQHALEILQEQSKKLTKTLDTSAMSLEVLTAVADRSATGILVVEESGKVRFANALARQAMLAPGELAIVNDQLRANTPRVQRLLADALPQAVSSKPRATRIPLPTSEGEATDIFITPLPTMHGGTTGMRPLALLLVGRRGHVDAMPSEDDLRQLFDFTPAESNVALMLCAGQAPKEIARDLHISITTVRSQVSSLLAKTGTARQVDLVRLIASLPRR